MIILNIIIYEAENSIFIYLERSEIMNYKNLAIMITNRCDINCGMCCEGQVNNSDMTEVDMLNFLMTLNEEPSIENIAITGGEPFLKLGLMEEIIKISKKNNKNTSVITNANWCVSFDKTYEVLSKLKSLGLGSIGISYDEFHQKYVDAEKIRNILKTCELLKLRTNIQICITKDSDIGPLLNQLKTELDKVIINFIYCMDVGRAKANIPNSQLIYKQYDENILCQKGGSLLIGNDGKVFPCCSPMAYNLDIDLGNISELNTIQNVLKKIKNNIFLLMLRNYGFKYFLDKSKLLNITLPEKIVSPCDICAIFLSRNNMYKILPYILQDIENIKLGRNPYEGGY